MLAAAPIISLASPAPWTTRVRWARGAQSQFSLSTFLKLRRGILNLGTTFRCNSAQASTSKRYAAIRGYFCWNSRRLVVRLVLFSHIPRTMYSALSYLTLALRTIIGVSCEFGAVLPWISLRLMTISCSALHRLPLRVVVAGSPQWAQDGRTVLGR